MFDDLRVCLGPSLGSQETPTDCSRDCARNLSYRGTVRLHQQLQTSRARLSIAQILRISSRAIAHLVAIGSLTAARQ